MVLNKVRVVCVGESLPDGRIENLFEVEADPAPSTHEDAQRGRFEEATKARHHLGFVKGLPPGIVASVDGFGVVRLIVPVMGTDPDGEARELLLSKNDPVVFGGVEVTCEQVVPTPAKRQDDRPPPLRLWHWLTRARCQKCFYFDLRTAAEWRDRVTHMFGGTAGGADGILSEHMNHDITKMSADLYGLPDIPKEHFGYCSRRWTALHGALRPCREYKRRTEVK